MLCRGPNYTRDSKLLPRKLSPTLKITPELVGGPKRGSSCDSTKLMEMGFQYKYDMKKILDDSVDTGFRLGALPLN
ncbi:unnamed protein product [Camellia sinensis]